MSRTCGFHRFSSVTTLERPHDRDQFDPWCRHLLVRDTQTREVIATLWQGIAAHVTSKGIDYLFGCASIGLEDGAAKAHANAAAAQGLSEPRRKGLRRGVLGSRLRLRRCIHAARCRSSAPALRPSLPGTGRARRACGWAPGMPEVAALGSPRPAAPHVALRYGPSTNG
jgi:hypothetical protein